METTRNRTSRAGRRIGSVCVLGLALAVFGSSAGAGSGGGNPFDNTISDPNGEEVGTLPSIAGSTSLWLPSIALTGTQADVFALVARVDGVDPAVGVSTLADGRIRYVLYGEASVALDRAVLATGAVEVSLQVGQLFAGGVSQLTWNGQPNPVQVLPAAGDVPLGVDVLTSPRADDAVATLSLVSLRRWAASVDIVAGADSVQLEVQHPE